MKYIRIDLHSNSFTACYLEEGKPQRIETFPLQESSLKRFVKTLGKKDEIVLSVMQNSPGVVIKNSPTTNPGGINVRRLRDQGSYSSIRKIGEINVKRTSS